MILTKQAVGGVSRDQTCGSDRVLQYEVEGLPPGESAFIAEFPQRGWQILRWNDEWHGNWSGRYPTADAALEALREELMAAAC
jgi:hypothetical protein